MATQSILTKVIWLALLLIPSCGSSPRDVPCPEGKVCNTKVKDQSHHKNEPVEATNDDQDKSKASLKKKGDDLDQKDEPYNDSTDIVLDNDNDNDNDDDDDDDNNPLPQPKPADITVTEATTAGTACPGGAALTFDETTASFTLDASDFYVEIGSGTPIREKRKACSFTINFDLTPGWTFAIGNISSQVTAQYNAQTTGLIKATVHVQGETENSVAEKTVTGPLQIQTEPLSARFTNIQYAPCDASRSLVGTVQLRLSKDSPGAQGLAKLTSPVKVGVIFQQCP